MNPTHIHLILTHFPIIGTMIGAGILIYGMYKKNLPIQQVALGIFIIMAILTIPVYLSGEEAEETVEHLADVSEKIIHNHEELAEKAIFVIGLLGFASSFFFYNKKKQFIPSGLLIKFILALSIITSGLFALVGNYGGQIRHSEIRKDAKIIKSPREDDDDD